ncbi:uncharacterized protein [Drosophila pseudoobscura]|uniref:FZ domain-containing protein n=1 Tax=Drosophila pseudoobscura pseudoobscura TaxID=46245 RepID=A0A6I8UJE3_DROPS|nr:uncharacterized protein LOC4816904 [Drosophila pseudoobscura]
MRPPVRSASQSQSQSQSSINKCLPLIKRDCAQGPNLVNPQARRGSPDTQNARSPDRLDNSNYPAESERGGLMQQKRQQLQLTFGQRVGDKGEPRRSLAIIMDEQKPQQQQQQPQPTLDGMSNEASSVSGLRRQPTKYPHGLNITVQTIDDDYSRASTLRSKGSSSEESACWSDTHKYRIGMLGSPEALAELQVRRYKYPLTSPSYYLEAAQQKPTPLMLLGYARRACRWKYLRWPIIFVASVLLFFGLITYCLWLHDVSVARARFLQRRHESAVTSSTSSSSEVYDEETSTTTDPDGDGEPQETTRLRAVEGGEHTTEFQPEMTLEEGQEEDYDDTLLPADSIRFTSGHQNSFGVPIEQDKRMLQLLKDLLPRPQATPPGHEQPLTRVSPTLPPPSAASGRPTEAMSTTPSPTNSGCYSTMLPMCQGVLDYDLTYNREGSAPRDAAAMAAYEDLLRANCSARAIEFVCAALEPECRPSPVGQLPPCRRICKAILEACSIAISNSDVLSELFDCSQYPDAHESHKCEDPTRRRDDCYANEFQCHDGSCIPQQWQCDKIKDCSGGEDEDEQCLVCEQQDEFRCRSNEKCIPEGQRCDLNFDCLDGSDEEDCDEYGSGDSAPFDEAELNAFPRVFSYASFLSPNETNDKLYTYITATTDEEAGTETKFQIHQVAAPVPTPVNGSSGEAGPGPKGFVNFRDSKEIMMTSDSENKFKYSQRANRTSVKFSISGPTTPAARTASAIPSSALVQQRGRTTSTSTTTTTTKAPPTTQTAVTAPGGCLPHELRCVSGKCITVSQLCDKQIDCPDAADELMCVYRERPSGRRTTTTSSTTSTPKPPRATPTPTSSARTTSTNHSAKGSTTTRRSVRTTPNRSRKPKS